MCRSERKWLPLLVLLLYIFDNLAHGQSNAVSHLTTNFVRGAELNRKQVWIVLKLAAKAGLTQPSEIATIQYFPGDSYGIIVRGENRQDGRKSSSVEVLVDSSKLGAFNARTNSLRLQNFWINPPYLQTNYQISASIKGETKRISVSKEMTTEIVDTLIAGLPAAIAEFASTNNSRSAKAAASSLAVSDLTSIMYDDETKDYSIVTGSLGGFFIRCKLQNGHITIASISLYAV